MRSGNLIHRIAFYQRVVTRDDYGSAVETYPNITIQTRGEIKYTGGTRQEENNRENFGQSLQLTVRYNPFINQEMRVQVDNTSDTYIIDGTPVVIGRNESIQMTLTRIGNDMISDGAPVVPPIGLPSTSINVNTTTNLTGFIKGDGEKIYADDSVYVEAEEGKSLVDDTLIAQIHPIQDLSDLITSSELADGLAGLVGAAPSTLDTLQELGDALGDDPNFATTMTTALGNKVDKVTGSSLATSAQLTAVDNLGSISTKNIWTGTAAAYTALGTWDANTIYLTT